jgi:hypothetical protein
MKKLEFRGKLVSTDLLLKIPAIRKKKNFAGKLP